ncbi:YiiD C-terminal domain-containing protein [Luteimonas sp. 3794]|uniref:YiiD C-terminal domain-containing protein n=1 Tax=Luteimonas sp. 3794 TaxID=2817730 RepID=UPI0028658716|nr:YiiD C-terminal domain-containing protein [Luteimonas sp. 3794]MDR6990350.1 thioesterase domain-containing protein [Luteimonas sp. 3794]
MTLDDSLRALEAYYGSMPPVAAMDVSVAGYDGDCLRLHAPLSSHVNDKGSAFGGSLVSVMTLAAWGLVTLRVEQAGLDAEVYVADSTVRYRAPLLADLEAEATLDGASGDWAMFARTLRERGRARVALTARIALPDGGTATEMQARYVAIRRPTAEA